MVSTEGPGFKSAVATLSGNCLRQTVHTASVHQAAKLAALLWVARVTAGLAESNGTGASTGGLGGPDPPEFSQGGSGGTGQIRV